jgi:hypothetical protein
MTIEKSGYDSTVMVFNISQQERELLAAGLKPLVAKQQKRIEKMENNPKNEGQATFLYEIRLMRAEKQAIQQMITLLETTN